jgi:hypothetical protein
VARPQKLEKWRKITTRLIAKPKTGHKPSALNIFAILRCAEEV